MNAKQPDSVSRRKFLTAAGAAGVGLGVAAPAALGAEANDTAASSAMPRRPLGKTGWLTSIVGFGGGSRYQNQEDLAVAEKMIHRAIELGINYFDTAYMYQIKGVRESYRRYSKFLIPNYRKQILLVSKLAARDAE